MRLNRRQINQCWSHSWFRECQEFSKINQFGTLDIWYSHRFLSFFLFFFTMTSFSRKRRVWGANHSQPGDWRDTLLEQELGQGGFFCNIPPSQPWSHHPRLSEHNAVKVHITTTTLFILCLVCCISFYLRWRAFCAKATWRTKKQDTFLQVL